MKNLQVAKKITAAVCVFGIAWAILCNLAVDALGQVEPPKPVVVPPKFKAVAPPTVKAGDHIIIDCSSATGSVFFFFDETAFPKTRATLQGKVLILSTGVNGSYTVHVASLEDKAKEKIIVTVTGGVEPGPPPEPDPPPKPPVDPLVKLQADVTAIAAAMVKAEARGAKQDARLDALEARPPPGPKPPDPPTPDVSPIPVAGFRVMIIEDKEKLSFLPPSQLSIRTSKAFRDYVDANCVVEPDGKTKAYRIWDYKTNATGDMKLWQDALTRPRTSLPWIIVSNHPNGGYEGPLPSNVEDTIQLLKKVKGN